MFQTTNQRLKTLANIDLAVVFPLQIKREKHLARLWPIQDGIRYTGDLFQHLQLPYHGSPISLSLSLYRGKILKMPLRLEFATVHLS